MSSAAPSRKMQVTEAELAQIYQGKRSELQALAQKISELESDADEHKWVFLSVVGWAEWDSDVAFAARAGSSWRR